MSKKLPVLVADTNDLIKDKGKKNRLNLLLLLESILFQFLFALESLSSDYPKEKHA
jgi:hypothetical protein